MVKEEAKEVWKGCDGGQEQSVSATQKDVNFMNDALRMVVSDRRLSCFFLLILNRQRKPWKKEKHLLAVFLSTKDRS